MSSQAATNADLASLARTLHAAVTASWVAQAAYVAAELRLADLLADQPQSPEELAIVTGTHAPSLKRLLQALCSVDICRERDDGCFEMTPMGSLLGTEVPDSLRSSTIWWGAHLWPVWGNLLYSVRTGKSARAYLLGSEGFDHLERDPEAARVFNQALVEWTQLASAGIVQAYDFSPFRRIVDVGGGYGELLATILKTNPAVTGVLFDLPHALEGARLHFEKAGLADRCEFVVGDFFESVPSGGDAYLLKSVLHDWNDERSGRILESCRRALKPNARLLIVEQVMPNRLDNVAPHQSLARSDLTMLVAHAARERTEADHQALLRAAGLVVERIVRAGPTFSVIEASARE